MSRTMSHVPWKHWNLKVTCHGAERLNYYEWTHRIVEWEDTIGHELYDLRFYAGCKRVPQRVHRERIDYSYARTWGHAHAVSEWAHTRRRRERAEELVFARSAAKFARAGEPMDDLLEPEGRTRHTAVYDAF